MDESALNGHRRGEQRKDTGKRRHFRKDCQDLKCFLTDPGDPDSTKSGYFKKALSDPSQANS